MDPAKIVPPLSKSRLDLLSEISNIKENAYYRIIKYPAFFLCVIFLPKITVMEVTSLTIALTFIILDLILSINRTNKKITLLYEIEKNRENLRIE